MAAKLQIPLKYTQPNIPPSTNPQASSLRRTRTPLNRPNTPTNPKAILDVKNAITPILIARPNIQIPTMVAPALLIARTSPHSSRLTNSILVAIALGARTVVGTTDALARTPDILAGGADAVQAARHIDALAAIVSAAVDGAVAYAAAEAAFVAPGRAHSQPALLVVETLAAVLVAWPVFGTADAVAGAVFEWAG
jgi:hypothetical protein